MSKRAEIIKKIDSLYGDTEHAASDTMDDLEHIQEHLNQLMDALEESGVSSSTA